MAKALHGAAAKKVGARRPLELARTRAGHDEAQCPSLFHQVVDDIEQVRGLLDFVDDENVAVGIGIDDVNKMFRPGQKSAAYIRLKEVHGKGVGELLVQPKGFSCSARSKKEEAPLGEAYKSLFHTNDYIICRFILQEFFHCYGKICTKISRSDGQLHQ